MSEDDLTATIAHSLAMTYGAHINPPKGGKDWRAAENLQSVIAAEIRRAKAEAWDEGYQVGAEDEQSLYWDARTTGITNPYREEDDDD